MPNFKQTFAFLSALVFCGVCGRANDAAPPASERFASESSAQPDFRRHVLPVMGRLGCNGRACHGSFQGRGGFRLSLFGYDFAADHEAMTAGDEPRVNLKDPASSLVLQKPTLQVDHEGEKRMDVGSWQYNILRRWIEQGAPGVKPEDAEFEALEIEPREIAATATGQSSQLRVIARWTDGSREDVTALCRFRSNDESIATIDENGKVTVVGKGDSDVVAFYDNGVVSVPVLAPVTDLAGERYPQVPTPTKIDELVVAKLRKLGVVPSELSTDDEFLRRVSLDVTGSLPLPEEVTTFVADTSPDKRARKIEELLSRPTYAAWWATRLCDITGDNEQNLGERRFRRQQAEQWYRWIYRRVEQNMPYDKLVEGIVLAVGRQPGQSFEDYAAEMNAYYRPEDPADFAARETMPHYWARRQFNQAKDKAMAFSYAFLGVRLQCAECHKHPFDQWTKQDFEQFGAFFDRVAYGYAPDAKNSAKAMQDALGSKKIQDKEAAKLIAEGKVLPWSEVYIRNPGQPGKERRDKAAKKQGRPAGRVITPKLLGGDEVVAEQYRDPRQALMEWMRDEANPYFAKAWVNRVWASYFNVGIIEPPDDMNLANPPSNEPLLSYLTRGFVEHGYDMKWLHREILNSRTYQLSWRDNDSNRLDTRNFSHAIIRRLPAEVAYDAIVQATAASGRCEQTRDNLAERAIGISSSYTGLKRGGGDYVLNLFGKPARATNCDCERSNEPSLLQTIYLRNDQSMLGLLDRADGWLKQIDPASSRPRKNLEAEQAKLTEAISQQEQRLKEAQGDDAKKAKAIERELAALQKQAAQVARSLENEHRRIAKQGNADIVPIEASPEELVRQVYLRTLSRLPKQDEQAVALRYLNESETPASGMKDLMWALLNTKEFIVNR